MKKSFALRSNLVYDEEDLLLNTQNLIFVTCLVGLLNYRDFKLHNG